MVSKHMSRACLIVGLALALPVQAADRVHPGLWEVSMELNGRTLTRPMCLTQADADAINGDAKSIKAYAEPRNAKAGCKITDIQVDGQRVTVKSVCANGRENVGTTTYHGDRYESTNSGVESRGRWVGKCSP